MSGHHQELLQTYPGVGRGSYTIRMKSLYLDIVEEIDAVLDVVGNVICFDVSGCLEVQSKLSGICDLLLTFKDPAVIDDSSFHPFVRYARYEADSVVSFVPPDGNFKLKLDGTQKKSDAKPPLSITWKIPLASLSGLSVAALSVTGERYKPYTGSRSVAVDGAGIATIIIKASMPKCFVVT